MSHARARPLHRQRLRRRHPRARAAARRSSSPPTSAPTRSPWRATTRCASARTTSRSGRGDLFAAVDPAVAVRPRHREPAVHRGGRDRARCSPTSATTSRASRSTAAPTASTSCAASSTGRRRTSRRGGVLAVEVGAGEAPAAVALFAAPGFAAVEVERDYARIERVVSGVLENAERPPHTRCSSSSPSVGRRVAGRLYAWSTRAFPRARAPAAHRGRRPPLGSSLAQLARGGPSCSGTSASLLHTVLVVVLMTLGIGRGSHRACSTARLARRAAPREASPRAARSRPTRR